MTICTCSHNQSWAVLSFMCVCSPHLLFCSLHIQKIVQISHVKNTWWTWSFKAITSSCWNAMHVKVTHWRNMQDKFLNVSKYTNSKLRKMKQPSMQEVSCLKMIVAFLVLALKHTKAWTCSNVVCNTSNTCVIQNNDKTHTHRNLERLPSFYFVSFMGPLVAVGPQAAM